MEGKMLDKIDMFESRVRERAFVLWQEAGCPENTADEYWHRAREIEMREYNLTESDMKKVEKEPSEDPADFA
jgi:hypothetical protein